MLLILTKEISNNLFPIWKYTYKEFSPYSPWALLYLTRITSSLISNFQIILLTLSPSQSPTFLPNSPSKNSYQEFNALSVFTSWILFINVLSDYNKSLKKFEVFLKNLLKLGFDCLAEILPFFFGYLFAGLAIFSHSKRFGGFYEAQ